MSLSRGSKRSARAACASSRAWTRAWCSPFRASWLCAPRRAEAPRRGIAAALALSIGEALALELQVDRDILGEIPARKGLAEDLDTLRGLDQRRADDERPHAHPCLGVVADVATVAVVERVQDAVAPRHARAACIGYVGDVDQGALNQPDVQENALARRVSSDRIPGKSRVEVDEESVPACPVHGQLAEDAGF